MSSFNKEYETSKTRKKYEPHPGRKRSVEMVPDEAQTVEVRNRDLGSFPKITQSRQDLNPGSLTLELITQLSSYYRDVGLIPGLGRCPGEGKDYPFQYSGLENSMECRVRGVSKSGTQLSDFHFHFQRYEIQ